MIRRILLLSGVVLLFTTGVAHAQYEPASITISNNTLVAGEAATLTGSGFGSGAVVAISMCGQGAGSATADGSGVATATVTAPTGPSGDCSVTMSGIGASGVVQVLGISITLGAVSQQQPTQAGGLPRTGSDNGWLTAVAAGLIACGGLLVVASRRRASARVDS